jgi:hypothetical protein
MLALDVRLVNDGDVGLGRHVGRCLVSCEVVVLALLQG